jgi:hypothetical protein
MKRFVFRLICIALLLAAQQTALTHALAHAQDTIARAGIGGQADDGSEHTPRTQRFALCDFDYAYSQVLGAVHVACVPPLKLDASFEAFPVRSDSRVRTTEVPFLIRGPPQHL